MFPKGALADRSAKTPAGSSAVDATPQVLASSSSRAATPVAAKPSLRRYEERSAKYNWTGVRVD
jgi:hypothetical protein